MKEKYLRVFLNLFLFLFYSNCIFAQALNLNIKHYSVYNGLSQNTVNHVMQSSDGFLWISTQDGLNKYNGYYFTNFRHSPTNPQSLSSNYVNMVCEGSEGYLWAATQYGLSRLKLSDEQFETFYHETGNKFSLPNNSVDFIFEDSQKTIWLKTKYGISRFNRKTKKFHFFKHRYNEFTYSNEYNHFQICEAPENPNYLWVATQDGLARFDKESEQFAYFYPTGRRDNSENEIFHILPEDEDTYWIASAKGLFKFNPKNQKFVHIPFHSEKEKAQIRVIYKDSKGLLWLGTGKGVSYYDRYNNSIVELSPTDDHNHQINFGRVSAINQDNAEILWIGSENGLYKIDRKKKKFKTLRQGTGFGPNLNNNRIYSIFIDKNKRLWLGSRNYGLNIIDPETKKVTHYDKENSGLEDNDIHCIQEDRKGRICIGTTNGAFYYQKDKKDFAPLINYRKFNLRHRFKRNRISKIIQDRNMNYWFATNNGLLFFNGKTIKSVTDSLKNSGYSDFQVFDIIERENGEVWAASTAGVSRIFPKSGKVRHYTKENSGLSNSSAMTLIESSDRTLWVGSETGLNKYSAIKDSFIFYTSDSHGLSNDYIYTILEDDNADLWLSTNKGLIRFTPQTEEVRNFNPEDGLQHYEFNIGAAFKSESGNLYFGGVNGVNIVNPENMPINTFAPPPVITRFEKISSDGREEVPLPNNGSGINLESNERSFTIYFTIPEYTHPHLNQFKYRISELEEDWNSTENYYVSYNRLRPGTYTFQVKGANSDNVWNETPAELIITIEAPWWNTGAAYFLYIFITLVLLFGGFMFYNRKIRKENRILIEKQKASKKIATQREELAIKNQSIQDSIHYAKRIIDAMIPSENFFKRYFPESFILFMPKDIVSGDFYWLDTKDDKIFVAAGDCTGHGVPGAFMSIVGLDLLRDILSLGIESPSEILDRLNSEVTKIFINNQSETNIKDGMDIAICSVDKKKKELQYAGAKNPLYLIRDGVLKEYKADRMSIGPDTRSDTHQKFTNHSIKLEEGDVFYIFSDGYADQFGGEHGKKFKFRRFRHMLLNMYNHDFEYQKLTLLETYHSWKHSHEQVDDIIVLGINPLS